MLKITSQKLHKKKLRGKFDINSAKASGRKLFTVKYVDIKQYQVF